VPEFRVLFTGDEIIQRVIANYATMVEVMVRLLTRGGGQDLKILDLGSGSGRISEVICQWMPTARLTLLDASDEVLVEARQRLSAVPAAYVTGDYTSADLGHGYDAIVAGLTLHHLSDPQKRDMYSRLHEALGDGGTLVVSDIVLGSTPLWDEYYEAMWLDSLTDLPAEHSEHVRRHYLEADHPASLEDHAAWLADAGFVEVACHWRHLNFAVFSGQK